MARNITSTTPAGTAGLHMTPADAVAFIRDNGLDATAVEAMRADHNRAFETAVIAGDLEAARAHMSVRDALVSGVEVDTDRMAAARVVAMLAVGNIMLESLSDRARAMFDAGTVEIDARYADRLGALEVADGSSDGGTFGAAGTRKRPVGPAVMAYLEAHGGAWASNGTIAEWVTANEVGGYRRAVPLSSGAVDYYATSKAGTPNGTHRDSNGITRVWDGAWGLRLEA